MTGTVVEVLEEQHRRVVELFEQVSSPDVDRPAVLHNLLKELAAHVAAERSAVQPVVKDRDIGEGDLNGQLLDDYERMEKLMVLIERRKFNSPDIPELVTELKDVTEAHVSRSERDLFPGLAGRLSPEEQREVGAKVDHEDQMVSTHPHPHLLSLGPLASRLTGLMSRFDFLRDKTVNNRHPGDTPGGTTSSNSRDTADRGDHGDPSMGGAT